MNQRLIDAITDITNERLGEECDDFINNVEYETKAEWLEKLINHSAYQYIVLCNHGDLQAIEDHVEEFWNDYGNPEEEAEEEAEEEEEATQELYPQQ
jgi:hypothetical protein